MNNLCMKALLVSLLALLAAAARAQTAAPPLPEGFAFASGSPVSAVRLDKQGVQGSFAANKESIERTCEQMRRVGSPQAGTPVFEPGWDRPFRTDEARFITLDRSAEVKLQTHFTYGCSTNANEICRCRYEPQRSRTQQLRKIVDGRPHTWRAQLEAGTGRHDVAPQRATRLTELVEGGLPLDQLGSVVGESEHLGYRCEVRAVRNMKGCHYVPQPGVPIALHDVLAWIEGDDPRARGHRLSYVGVAAQVPATWLEPTEGVRWDEADGRRPQGRKP
jgi:hypothetical protein